MSHKQVLIGVAWPYVNATFHLGNLYGSFLPADFYARFQRMQGHDVVLVSGSDCHGTPVTIKADEEGTTPEAIAAKYHVLDQELLEKMNVSMSLFTKTATINHREVVQQMFLDLMSRGYISKKVTKQLYSPSLEKFVQDRYIEGECPHCHSDRARGDQCDGCGKILDALDVIHPVSKLDKQPLEIRETENYFIDLAKLQPDLEQWLESKEAVWRTWIYKETMGWLKEGLRERAITRDLTYGVPLPVEQIPDEMRLADIDKKCFYVWFEAVVGYMSATKEYLESEQRSWLQWWDASSFGNDGIHAYFIGEDNLVFHTINWPAQLMASGKNYVLPTHVFATKFLMLEGDKWSKSRGWFIDTAYLLNTYNVDALRFYLASIATRDDQTNFLWSDFANTTNGVLSAKIGNLIHRVLTFTRKNYGTHISDQEMEVTQAVAERIDLTFAKTQELMEQVRVRETIQEIVSLAEYANEYLTKHEFWKLFKEDVEACRQVLYDALTIISSLRILLSPFTPDLAIALAKELGYDGISPVLEVTQWKREVYPVTNSIPEELTPLVTQIDLATVELEKEKLMKQKQ